ncbi:MAG: PspA-associated protein PspAB [Acidimicrobiales bacterium]
MGLLDTILGRTKPVRANLDKLFALPAAAVTLQVSAGLVTSGHAGVCFKPPSGQPFEEVQADLERLLALPDDDAAKGSPATAVRHVADKYGYRWIVIESPDIDDLVTRVHMVHSSLEEAGWSTQLLCSVFGFVPASGNDVTDAVSRPLYLVYLAKQGTFYPFAPTTDEQRDTELELRMRSVIGSDLPVESDLSRWFPLWDLPLG